MLESIFTFLFKYRPLVFEQGELKFAAPLPAVVLLLAVALVAALAVWTYGRVGGRARSRDRVALTALRVAALALLALALLRPVLLVSTVVPQQNFLGVLIDDSRSMRVADDGPAPRSAFVRQTFGPDSPLLDALAQKFQLRFFRFSSDVDRLGDVTGLTYDGGRTRIAPALDRAREELAPVPLSGLVLVTDGADNSEAALTESLLALKAADVPVYTVGVGRERYEHDIELSRVATPREALEGASLVVDLLVSASGYEGRTVPVLVEDAGRIVGTQDVTLPPDGEPATVRVHFTAEDVGPRHLRFRIPPQDGELVLQNNEQDALVVVKDDREKILYFEGEPRFEVKFMRRAVEDDENLQLVTLQRTAENKFLRLSVDSAQELLGGFPKTREELFRFRGLVLGSIEASYFTHEQLRMIEDFVSERGGGLLMLGGRKAFSEGGWAGTPVQDVLPVYLDPALKNDTLWVDSVKVAPTRAGLSSAITQIADTEAESAERWKTLPRLIVVNRVNRLKPGATALLTGSGDGLPDGQVVLAQQRYGRGQALAFPVENSWYWQMAPGIPLEDMTHETFWRQLLRYLVSDVPEQVTVALPSDRVTPDEPVRITATVDDASYLKVNSGAVSAKVTSPGGDTTRIPLEWTVDRDGEYGGSFTPHGTGLYTIQVTAVHDDRTQLSEPAYVRAAESTSEYFGSQMRRPLLERIAVETGGRFYTPATVGTLPEDISVTGRGTTVVEEKELWDMPAVLLVLLTLVAAEWLLRRRRGLA